MNPKQKPSKQTHIKDKISKCFLTLIFILCIVLGLLGIALNYITTMDEMVKLAAERVSVELQLHLNVAGEIGQNAILTDPNTTRETKEEILNNKIEYYNYKDVNLISAKGIYRP